MRVLVIPDIHLKPWIFDRAIAFVVDYPDTLWCYGNHDVSYSWGRLESGYSPYAERTVMSKLEELENSLKSPAQINIMHRIDNVLFSHGGLKVNPDRLAMPEFQALWSKINCHKEGIIPQEKTGSGANRIRTEKQKAHCGNVHNRLWNPSHSYLT